MSKGPVSPEEFGAGMDDAALEEAGYASGLDVWGQVEKAYENYLGDGALSNSQLWSLKRAILTEAAGPVTEAAVLAAAKALHNTVFNAELGGYSACPCADREEHDEKWHAAVVDARRALEAAARTPSA